MNTIVFLYGDRLYHHNIETPGSVIIGSGKKAELKVDAMPGTVTVRTNRYGAVSVESTPPMPYYDNNAPLDTMIVLSQAQHAALYVMQRNVRAPQRLKLPYNCIAQVGRSDKCHVTIKNPYVSGRHFTIRSEAGVVRVEDLGSTNGLYLNGRRITKARMQAGDVLSILHINIRLVGNELEFENVGNALTIHGLEAETAIGGQARREDSGQGTLKYRRSPRTQERLPEKPIILDPPPASQGEYKKRRGMFGSVIGMGAMTAASLATGGGASAAMLLARSAGLISPVASMVAQGGSEKERKKKMTEYELMRQERYGQYIQAQKSTIEEVARLQREILTRENPSAVECLANLQQLKRSLWERSPGDRDFLDVRLGMGYEDLCVPVKAKEENGFRMEMEEIRQLAQQIVEETRIVDSVPARLSLRKYNTISIIGDRRRMVELVRNMIVSLTMAHCHEEVRIVGIFDERERQVWESLRWLPHVWDKSQQGRYLAFDQKRAHELCELFQEILKERAEASRSESYGRSGAPLPHYIFLLGSRAYVEKEEIMKLLTDNDPALGVTSLFLFNDMYSLPHSCQFIVDVDNGPCGFVRNEVNNKFFFTMDTPVSSVQLDAYARTMSAIELEGFAVQAPIPQGINFLRGYGVSRVEELQAAERWKNNRPYKSMAVPIGVMEGGKLFSLDINEKAHGPHGLVAGTNGSGKSETIISWILSMCTNFHPHEVAFVIIDYKGGGMANMVEDLPHVVGKITNIGSNINRSLLSLKSELVRRQKIFDQYSEYQINHIDKYQKLYREGKASEPLPHLIIVADEFAELRQNEPEFMSGLVSAARIGRSLGIHLVLATQKPSGVVDDQIQSNSKFRLCHKVVSVGDSREMIKRPDAASIRQPGRTYILVGEDDLFALFQSFYSGAPYLPGANNDTNENKIRMVDITGERSAQVKKERTTVKSEMDELTAIRRYLCRVAEQQGIRKLDGPWLEELPDQLTLQELQIPGGFDGRQWTGGMPWLKVPIGKYDDPVTQKQGIQYLDLSGDGNYGIFGAPKTGKTSLLKTIAWSLSYYYTPQDVNIYIMDFGGWSMNVFADLPHVGDVALDYQKEKIQKLQKMLMEELSTRKTLFLRNRVSNIEEYRKITGGAMPAIVLMIDNIVPVFDQYQEIEDLLTTIGREGAGCGIYLIYTANATKGVRTRVSQYVKGAISFEQIDKTEYQTILGRMDGKKLPQITGRAFFGCSPNPPREYQSALYMPGETELDRSIPMQSMAAAMDASWTGHRPARIPVMPETLSYDELYRRFDHPAQIPVGLAYDSIQPAVIDLSERYGMLISGTVGCGKSRLMEELAMHIYQQQPDAGYYVFDSTRRSLAGLRSLAHGYTIVGDTPEAAAVTNQVADILNDRLRQRNRLIGEQGDAFSPEAFAAELKPVYIFIDDLAEFADKMASSSDPREKTPQSRMKAIMSMAKGLGVIVFAAGRVSDLIRNSTIEALTNIMITNQKAVAIGGKPSLHSYFNNDLNYQEKEAEMKAGDAYVFDSGHSYRIKLPE